jgi:hypothetical protein
MRRLLALLGLTTSFLIAGAAGGFIVMIAVAQAHQGCKSGIICRFIDKITIVESGGVTWEFVSSLGVQKLRYFGGILGGERNRPSASVNSVDSNGCVPIGEAVVQVCTALRGGLSGAQACDLINQAPR